MTESLTRLTPATEINPGRYKVSPRRALGVYGGTLSNPVGILSEGQNFLVLDNHPILLRFDPTVSKLDIVQQALPVSWQEGEQTKLGYSTIPGIVDALTRERIEV